jgi:MFS family permease
MRDALTYMFKRRGWLPLLLIGGYLPLTVIGWPVASGYLVETLQLAQEGHLRRLPPWGRWGDRLVIGLIILVVDSIYVVVLPLLLIGGLTLCVSGFICGLTSVLSSRQEGGWPAGVLWVTWALGGLYLVTYFVLGIGPITRLMWLVDSRAESALTLRWVLHVARHSFRDFWPARRVSALAYFAVLAAGAAGAGLVLWLRGLTPLLGWMAAFLAAAVWAPIWFWARLVAAKAYGDVAARLDRQKLVRPGM